MDSSSGPPPERPSERPPELRRLLAYAAAAIAVELVYVFMISAGRFAHWPVVTSYVNDLAEGFRQGHLHLATEPPAALLAKPNPFDPANANYWLWDASLYGGHYYLYWGPVPALLLAVFKTLLRISSVVGDQVVVFAFTSLQFLAGVLFLERAGRRLFTKTALPLVLELAAVGVVGLGNPTLYNLARPAIYEAAIVGGQAFLLLGLVFAFDAVFQASARSRRLSTAVACWVAAVGCRTSLGPAVAVMTGLTFLALALPKQDRRQRLVQASLRLGFPAVLGLFILLGYNRLRFGAWFDFGLRHQLTWINMGSGPAFIGPNLYAYLRRPPVWSCRFPFAYAILDMGLRAFPPRSVLPPGYFVYEQVAGILPSFPWSWLALPALAAAARSTWRTRMLSAFDWAVATIALGGAGALAPLLALATATNRYLGDLVGLVALLGALGAFIMVEVCRERTRLRRLAIATALVLAAGTVGIGLALGIKGQYAHFQTNNPALYDQMVRHLSACHGEIPPEPK
jgi:hypothetical protein